MQGFGDYCNKMNISDTLTLKDIRDDNEYTVAKLKDGRCWMTQNLRIVGPIALNSNDSDVSSNFILPQNTNSWQQNNYNISQIYVHPGYKSIYGASYNWYSATAGEGTTVMASSTAYTTSHSICPKGWKLPDRSEAIKLASLIGGEAHLSPNNFVYSGVFNFTVNTLDFCTVCSNSPSVHSTYWTATGAGGQCSACPSVLIYNTGPSLYEQDGWGAADAKNGGAIRCILR